MSEAHVEWTTPAPLWWQGFDPADALARRAFRTPAILRFATDSFMDDFHNLMKVDPARLAELVALAETWSAPPGLPETVVPKSGLALKLNQLRSAAIRRLEAREGKLPAIPASPADRPLKLYQPAHQRFYLVSACLVCRMVGLPDRAVDTSNQEKVSFVVRLLQPRIAGALNPDPSACDELAFIDGAWQYASDPTLLLDGEETNPLAPFTYTEIDRRMRRLFTGLVPIGRREAYLAATQPQPGGAAPPFPVVGPIQMLFKTQVTVPWASLEDTGKAADKAATPPGPDDLQPPTTPDYQKIRNDARDQITVLSWYVLLDFANYLANNLGNVWNGAPQSAAEQTLFATLATTRDAATGRTLLSALQNAKQQEQTLENIKTPYAANPSAWPSSNLIFPLAEPSSSGVRALIPALTRDTLESQVVAALPTAPAASSPPVRVMVQARSNPTASPWFAIRCVLERPNCSGLAQPVVSEPTAAFQMSAYFDPDAPARPIRIGLPVDTTPAGLRKFDKNTAFILSDTLCGQMQKVGSLTFADLVLSVLPWPFHKDLPSGGGDGGPCTGGMVCSFSIPIITICALILLIIIVALFNIIFFWLPFFKVCLPLPKFDAKGNS
jgi:hypothetical protein